MFPLPNLTEILDSLPWAVVGAVAARHYMPERATQDVDIAVLRKDAPEVRRRLQEADFRYAGELAIPGSSWISPEGTSVDVLELSAPWAESALQEAQENRDPYGFPILPLSYLILMKFEAGWLQDLADIARMLGVASSNQVEVVREVFRQYRPGDLEDLESLLTLGRLEQMGPEGASPPFSG
ncbi:MAG: hypothetical protein NZ572_04285 [Thermoflexus sp.]|nr:hypothetical protein [Thermoflexus sp.]